MRTRPLPAARHGGVARGDDATSWGSQSFPAAALICAIGFFMHIFFSAPVLNIIGIDYGSENASMAGKIHPGSYLIIISFFVLLFSRNNPLEQVIRIAREYTAYFLFVTVYVVIFLYWIIRGPGGVGLIIDIHIVMPMCAIVFSYAPRTWYRPLVFLFAGLALANAALGVFESATHWRLFPFDPDWEVLKQDYFRASALMGHPLINAAFNGTALFVLLNLRVSLFLKAIIFLVMLSALIAFGGRSALIFTLLGLVILGTIESWTYFTASGLTVMRMLTALLALVLVPAVCLGLLYGAVHSDMGERLMAYRSLEDDSATVRTQSLAVMNYMTTSDLVFGVDGDALAELSTHTGVGAPTSDIENPWVLMFLLLGGIMFPIWLVGLFFCVRCVLKGAPAALKLAVLSYFCIASTSNSFGRKDPIYLLIIGIVVCAKRLTELDKFTSQVTQETYR